MTEVYRRPRWRWAFVAIWAVAFAVALSVDRPVAAWASSSGVAAAVRGSCEAEWVKGPGDFRFFAVPLVIVLVAARQIRWRAGLLVWAVVAASALNGVVKWVVGRTRPFKLPGGPQPRPFELHPFYGGLRGITARNLTFPSGHEATAWAVAAALVLVWRPWAWTVLCLAVATGVERVLENAHYVSDVVGAIGFSTLLAWAVGRAMLGWANRPQGTAAVQNVPADGGPVR